MKTQKMDRFFLTVATGLLLAGSLTFAASAQEGRHGGRRDQQPQAQQPPAPQAYDRHDGKRWRDSRRDARWDEAQHNGYYLRNQWHAGPPPPGAYGRTGFSLGYQPWQRGQRLGYYQTRYTEVDYRAQHLRAPQRGYHWVRDDRGDYLLAAVATGLIASVIVANH